MADTTPSRQHPAGAVLAVFTVFLRLGLTSFGGPVAHLGYFRDAFVVRRRWLSEDDYADLVALCQFLPGPASSQAGFAIGFARAGFAGGLAAWTGFTLPSALLMFAFARLSARLAGPHADAAIHGLKLVAVAVVAQAVFGMARTLTPDARRAAVALAAAAIVLLAPGAVAQLAAIGLGAAAGLILCRGTLPAPRGTLEFPIGRRAAIACLLAFLALLAAAAAAPKEAMLAASFYRSGALVFGGGHVVLPLLREALVGSGRMSDASFLAGYGAAQAMPGPLFSIAAFLGAAVGAGATGAAIALVALFLPGMLILLAALPFWDTLRTRTDAQAAMRGVNAAVVGILAAALYTPLWTSAVLSLPDVVLAAAGFAALTAWRAPPVLVVAGITAAAMMLQAL